MHKTPYKQMMVSLSSYRLSLQTEAAKNIGNDHEKSRIEQCILIKIMLVCFLSHKVLSSNSSSLLYQPQRAFSFK